MTTLVAIDTNDISRMRQNALALRKMADNVLEDLGQLEKAARVPKHEQKKTVLKADIKANILSGHTKPNRKK